MTGTVETWKRIAQHLGRSMRWCQGAATRRPDPLPVFKVGGIVCAQPAALDGWWRRQRRPFGARKEAQKRATRRR